MKSNQTSKRNIGSARTLEGVTHVVHVFCSDNNSSWTVVEREDVLRRFRAGLSFIKGQSRQHQVGSSFVEHSMPDIRIKGVIPKKVQVNHVWTENVIRRATRRSGVGLVSSIRGDHEKDNVAICLHVNKSALSYNLAYYDNVDKMYGAERMVCFARYPDGRPSAAATYAHEMLHLFGAGDLYFPYDKDNARKRHAGRLFPNDVMYRVDYDLKRLDVGPYTAFRVGWTNDLDPRLTVFDD